MFDGPVGAFQWSEDERGNVGVQAKLPGTGGNSFIEALTASSRKKTEQRIADAVAPEPPEQQLPEPVEGSPMRPWKLGDQTDE